MKFTDSSSSGKLSGVSQTPSDPGSGLDLTLNSTPYPFATPLDGSRCVPRPRSHGGEVVRVEDVQDPAEEGRGTGSRDWGPETRPQVSDVLRPDPRIDFRPHDPQSLLSSVRTFLLGTSSTGPVHGHQSPHVNTSVQTPTVSRYSGRLQYTHRTWTSEGDGVGTPGGRITFGGYDVSGLNRGP